MTWSHWPNSPVLHCVGNKAGNGILQVDITRVQVTAKVKIYEADWNKVSLQDSDDEDH